MPERGRHFAVNGGVELLSQRRGLQAYVSDGKTMGIPFLHPWANRWSANEVMVRLDAR